MPGAIRLLGSRKLRAKNSAKEFQNPLPAFVGQSLPLEGRPIMITILCLPGSGAFANLTNQRGA
jgi:hypothetical protein